MTERVPLSGVEQWPAGGRRHRDVIDLRSDVVTPPTEAMWEAMRRAAARPIPFGDDPIVGELVVFGATLLGKETGLFVPTCSMANLLALMATTEPGDQIVLESTMHIVWSEGWGVAHPAGLFPRLLSGSRGVPAPEAVEEAIAVPCFGRIPRTGLVCLENSHNNAGGAAITPAQTNSIAEVAHRHEAAVHIDGARLFNAAAALGVPARALAEAADTVAVSLNKGLSAPEGALLCGPGRVIGRARRVAERLGAASLHKAGIAAAAALVGLTTMVDRLGDDNRRAACLAERISGTPGLSVDLAMVQTNIVLVELTGPVLAREFVARLAERGVLALVRSLRHVRFVTHRLIDDADVERTAVAVADAARSVR
jgi:threonine aldolase